MSSEERSTSFPHAEMSGRPSRHRRTPKHLEEYLLDYSHHRPALSSSPTAEVPVEQRGAAAAVGIFSQSRPDSSQGEHPATSSTDLLSMSSLRELMKSISEKERDEAADMAALQSKLKQYEKRQHRRKELMKHITSFLMEEGDEEVQSVKPATPTPNSPQPSPLSSHSSCSSQSPDIELHTKGQGHVSATQIHVNTPTVEAEDFNPGFVPIQPVNSLPLYSPLSSGTLPTSVPQHQHVTRTDTLPLLLNTQFCPYDDAGTAFQPQVQPQLVAPTPTYQHPGVPYICTTVASSPRQPVAAPPAFSFSVPHYATMPPLAPVPQTLHSASVPAMNIPTLAGTSLHPSTLQPLKRSEYLVPHRPLHAAPQPKIPDFVNDNEREFANLKLALDNLLEPHAELDEKYKYHILLEHLKLPEAQMIGQSCRHHPYPYSAAMQALQLQYGQPHQLAQSEIAAILTAPEVKPNDARSFQSFALRVHLLVSMLLSLEGPRGMELNCCSHVDRLVGKLPKYLRDGFIEFLQLQGKLNSLSINPYNLQDFAGWLHVKAQQQRLSSRLVQRYQYERDPSGSKEKSASKPRSQSTALYHGAAAMEDTASPGSWKKTPLKVNCLFCGSKEHYITRCSSIKEQSVSDLCKWISEGKRCWKCARSHAPETCNLKKPCSDCGGIHLQVLHGVARSRATNTSSATSESRIYLLPSIASGRVFLKVVPVLLHHEAKTIETYAILDDGAQRTMILPTAVQQLQLKGEPETLALRTVRPDTTHLNGSKVTFEISARGKPEKRYQVFGAFTASGIDLVEQSYPVQTLQRRYAHLRGVPLQPFHKVRPLVLIGSDQVHLITAKEPIRQGSKGGPVAVCTALGWALQGAEMSITGQEPVQQCFFISTDHPDDLLYRNVERLWQLDVLPFRNEKLVVRSRQDKEAMQLLASETERVNVKGVQRYATPLLWNPGTPELKGSMQSVLANLRNTERRLQKDPDKASIYSGEIAKLIEAGYVVKLNQTDATQTEAWYLPHHLVSHNNKHRLVFDCSFRYHGLSLNDQLLPGPTLGPSLLGVLLRFRQHPVAMSADIKGMFHQVRLLPKDRPFLRFIWRDLQSGNFPDVYEWQVLPFGTTSSPCCAIFALQHHACNSEAKYPGLQRLVHQSFYVDNCLTSFPTVSEAKQAVDQLRSMLAEGGFDLRQWASSHPAVVAHLPTEARSSATEQWLVQNRVDLMEPTLGLRWNCAADTLGYHYRLIEHAELTMRAAYQVLASQYDPLGFILPFTTRAKVIIQQLWAKKRDWDDPDLPPNLKATWTDWESELKQLSTVSIPRCYTPASTTAAEQHSSLHVFCDASERAYGAVAYLAVETSGDIHVSFVMARSRVAPKRQQSIPRLELCAALAGAQLAKLVRDELTLSISQTILWTDSMTVLEWIQSDSCRYKVFVGTRVTEIQELTDYSSWRYVNTQDNPADDITRGKTLQSLSKPSRWSQGPPFLKQSPEHWPKRPEVAPSEVVSELKGLMCYSVMAVGMESNLPDVTQFKTWRELVRATLQACQGAATSNSEIMTNREAEAVLLRACQAQSFPEEVAALKAKKCIPAHSRLVNLAPEWDPLTNMIRVGGRLRRLANSDPEQIHPIVLDPRHAVTKLLIQEFDERLLHPGAERVYAEIRRQYWVLRGRQAIKHHQLHCQPCQRWRAQPKVPQMADLPPERLRLLCPPFYSTGVDCFGPYLVKIGRRNEKRWGLIFKCLTTRAVHIELLNSMDVDAFLLALRRLIARRGQPREIRSDCGTNFRGAERELREAFCSMESELQIRLADHQIDFKLNPPSAPHFGGIWEREVRSIKNALQVAVGNQAVTEDVLSTILVEVEGILNSKPLGYASTDVADIDPITPNILLMGRRDASLPQVAYAPGDMGRRRWRHCQHMADQFWIQFTKNYLPTLQTRQKWHKASENLEVDSVVLIVDPQLPRAQWPIGRVRKTLPSSDGCVRTVEVVIDGKAYIRPVARLIQLPALEGNTTDS
ncbi:uncharacterized protein LOC120469772 [Pimephales promelas]|uniref:uncharacterized protein LOC120469772 n=1 Tax=Pimephales promelas TaxID=90988 RepID=UPI0019559F2D|nr:uncharacterized protein LOC120469772 [Pimephales promelas]